MRILMLVATSVASDARVVREAGALATAGHAVHIVGMGVPAEFVPPPGVSVSSPGPARRARGRRVGASSGQGRGGTSSRRRAGLLLRRAVRWLLLPEYRAIVFGRWARAAHRDGDRRVFDVVHAHDFNTLRPAAALTRTHRVPLVYDSHELWFGRPVIGRPTPLAGWRGQRTERRIGARAAAVITVGDGVAAALESRYNWRGVRIVRNAFSTLPPPVEKLVPRRLVYAGRLAPYRELDVVAVASRTLPVPVDLVGPADLAWLRQFDAGAARILPPVAPEQVTWLLREAGLALVTHSDRWVNHRLALPNKLFQAVAAGVPVVATDVGELAKIVRNYGLGTLYRPGDPASLATAVDSVLAGYEQYAAAVRLSAADLSWSVDEQVLLEIYAKLAFSSSIHERDNPPQAVGGGARDIE